jgi:hypothetical protein
LPGVPDATGCTEPDCCCESSALQGGPTAVEFGDHRLDPDQQAVRAAGFRLTAHRSLLLHHRHEGLALDLVHGVLKADPPTVKGAYWSRSISPVRMSHSDQAM